MGVSENVVYPIVPNGFADHYPYEKWLAIIGKINPTFSGPNPYDSIVLKITIFNGKIHYKQPFSIDKLISIYTVYFSMAQVHKFDLYFLIYQLAGMTSISAGLSKKADLSSP